MYSSNVTNYLISFRVVGYKYTPIFKRKALSSGRSLYDKIQEINPSLSTREAIVDPNVVTHAYMNG